MRQLGAPVGLGRIFHFWSPLASTWLLMAVEGPFLAAVIARLHEPTHNLAAFGVGFAVAMLVESPVIMLLSASTALVDGPQSFRKLRAFTMILNVVVTATMLLLVLTPLWETLARRLLELDPTTAHLSRAALLLLTPWPAAIGYRRFYQGVMIRAGRTRLVAYGTLTRLAAMATSALLLSRVAGLPGAKVGAVALSAGVVVEAIACRLMARRVVRKLSRERDDPARAPLTLPAIVSFYYPLALTSALGIAVQPMTTFFMGHARFPLESLAVLPVVNSLSFLFRSFGLAYQEVAIALLARNRENLASLTRFAVILALATSIGQALIVFTPLATFWLSGVSGLGPELIGFAYVPARLLVVIPGLAVFLSLERAILVDARNLLPVTWGTLVEVLALLVSLALTVHGFAWIGATAAALSVGFGRLCGGGYLLPPCLRALRGWRPAAFEARAPHLG